MKPKTTLILYNLTVCLAFTIVGVLSAKTSFQLTNSFIFLPLVLYFTTSLIKQMKMSRLEKNLNLVTSSLEIESEQRRTASSPPLTQISQPEVELEAVPQAKDVPDIDRRAFLRLIASSGVIVFLFALFTKKAQAAFFGSAPGASGSVSIKNTEGDKIDPSESHPTDGYEITQIDSNSSPAYYGFLKLDGRWYIMSQDSSGGYRYSKGSSNFASNWTNRARLGYDYFDTIFG